MLGQSLPMRCNIVSGAYSSSKATSVHILFSFLFTFFVGFSSSVIPASIPPSAPISPDILSTLLSRTHRHGAPGGLPGPQCRLQPIPVPRKTSKIQISFYFTRGHQEFRYPRHGSSKPTLKDLTSKSSDFVLTCSTP